MGDLALLVINPILISIGGENGMLHRKDKAPARRQPPANPPAKPLVIHNIVEGQGAEDQVELALVKIRLLNGAAVVGNARVRRGLAGFFQHFFRKVDSDCLGGALFDGIAAMPAKAAAQIQNLFACQRRKKGFQLPPFPGGGQPLAGAGHIAVFFKKMRVVILVFQHGFHPSSVLPGPKGFPAGSAQAARSPDPAGRQGLIHSSWSHSDKPPAPAADLPHSAQESLSQIYEFPDGSGSSDPSET